MLRKLDNLPSKDLITSGCIPHFSNNAFIVRGRPSSVVVAMIVYSIPYVPRTVYSSFYTVHVLCNARILAFRLYPVYGASGIVVPRKGSLLSRCKCKRSRTYLQNARCNLNFCFYAMMCSILHFFVTPADIPRESLPPISKRVKSIYCRKTVFVK